MKTQPSRRSVAGIIAVYVLIFWGIIPSFLLLTGFRLNTLFPVAFGDSRWLTGIGTLLILSGTWLMAQSMWQIRVQGKGLPISHLPPTELITTGLYRYFRHPVYVGYTLAFAGVAILLESFWSLTFSTSLFLLGWLGYVHSYEEPVLVERFGERYQRYGETTRRLFPGKSTGALLKVLQPALRRISHWLTILASKPILYRRGNVILVTYGLFVSIGTLLFVQFMAMLLLEQGLDTRSTAVFLSLAALLTFVCARLFSWLGHRRELVAQPLLGLRRLGFVSWGALTGLLVASFLFAAAYGYPLLTVTDVVVRGMFLAVAIGRIGCLTYGCCYGVKSGRWGVVYISPYSKVNRERGQDGHPRHPTPVYSFFADLTLFFVLNIMAYGSLPTGFITAAAFILYPLGRTFVEFHRDGSRYVRGIFTQGHIGCAVMFVSGWILLFLISPSTDPFSPLPWHPSMVKSSLSLLPVTLVIGAAVFGGTGLNWKEIGMQ